MAKKKASKPAAKTNGKKVSKTEAIRDELKATKNGSPSLVAKKLNARGIKVTPQYVSTIKAADKRKALSGMPNRRPGRPAGSGVRQQAVAMAGTGDLQQANDLMLKAVELVLSAGPGEARQLVGMAEKMVERIHQTK